jgi:hypothetical protein
MTEIIDRKQEKLQDQYQDYVLEKVEPYKDDTGFEIYFDDCTVFGIPNVGIIPQVGQIVRLYGKGFGYTVRGVDIDGQEVFYRNEAEEEKRFNEYLVEEKKKRLEKFAVNKEKYFADITVLPEVFQNRFDKFRNHNPDFDVDYGDYELFCCQQGVAIANAFEIDENICNWAKLDWEKQKEQFPELAEGHSGNTFDTAVMLARLYVSQPELVTEFHGALAALVGCEVYGCHNKENDPNG